MNKIALIDGDFLPFYVCHNKKLEGGSVENKSLQDCKDLLDSFIRTIMVNSGATHYIMALTVGQCFRYKVNPQYKANRKYEDPPEHLRDIKQYLKDAYNGFSVEGLEADDIVNICNKSTWFIGDSSIEASSFIVSPDKDLLMLAGRNYNPRKHQWVDVSAKQAAEYFWTSMITGDSIDGIKGLKGKGKAYASKVFNQEIKSPEYDYSVIVYKEYIAQLGVERGIEEFYKNYKCLKVLDFWEDCRIPEPIKYSIKF